MTYDLSEEERNEFFILIAKKLLPNDIMRKLANLEKLSPEEIGLFSRCTNLVRKYCEEHVRLPESGTLLIHFKDEQHLYKLVAGTDTNRTL